MNRHAPTRSPDDAWVLNFLQCCAITAKPFWFLPRTFPWQSSKDAFARRLYPDRRGAPSPTLTCSSHRRRCRPLTTYCGRKDFEFANYAHEPERQEAKWVHLNNPVVLVEVHTNLVHHPDLRASLSLTYDDIQHGPETPAVLLAIATLHGALHRFEPLRQIVDICQAARHLATGDDEAAFERVLQRMGGPGSSAEAVSTVA